MGNICQSASKCENEVNAYFCENPLPNVPLEGLVPDELLKGGKCKQTYSTGKNTLFDYCKNRYYKFCRNIYCNNVY